MAGPALIFGIGATKAGTSWLWDYLYHHPQCRFRAVKELHYFDALDRGSGRFFRKALARRVAELERAGRDGPLPRFRQAVLEDGRLWLDRFDGCTPDDAGYLDFIGLGRGDARVVGDITPAYSLLSEERYRAMAGLAGDVRFVFLLRDPVARLWSNVRMSAGPDASASELDATLAGVLAGDERQIGPRSNYRRTLRRLFRAVPRERVHLEFYERLFSPEAIGRLCGFLGIAAEPAAFDRVVHRGRPASLPPARLRQMLDFLEPQYSFVEALMGGLPEEWTQTMVKS